MSEFTVDILTPASVVAKGIKAKSLLVPTTFGQINLLESHTHLITKLETGILTTINDKEERHFLMTTGICKLLNDKVVILSAVTEESHVIDIERAKRAKEKALNKLKGDENLTDIELIKYQRKLERAEARLRLAYLR